MKSKGRLGITPTFCGLLMVLVGTYVMFFGDKTVILPSTFLVGGIVICLGMLYLIKVSIMEFSYRLDKLEDIIEKLGGNQDERTEDP